MQTRIQAISDYVFMTRQKPWNSGHISLNMFHRISDRGNYEMDRRVTGKTGKGSYHVLEIGHLFIRNHKVRGYYLPDLGKGLMIADDRRQGWN
jgi:hypothetical protein